jgi:hypothetical protein
MSPVLITHCHQCHLFRPDISQHAYWCERGNFALSPLAFDNGKKFKAMKIPENCPMIGHVSRITWYREEE